MKLLTTGNPKLMKGQKKGYLSFVLHLAPSNLSGYNVCPMASEGCRAACLNTAGRGGIFKKGETTNVIQQARIRKTIMFFEQRDAFMQQLVDDILEGIRKADRENMIPVFRLNGTSDIRWETIPVSDWNKDGIVWFENIMQMFPNIQFYDYTKLVNRRNIPANYHLTFSRSEENGNNAEAMLARGFNVAVVFDALPTRYLNVPVISGDDTDLRFLDPKGVIVGLKAKGKAKKDNSGFTVLTRRVA